MIKDFSCRLVQYPGSS